MISKENLNYAFRNLLNRKVRSALTILSVLVGITTIFIFISFGIGLYFYIEELSDDLGVNKILIQPRGIGAPGTDQTFTLTDDDVDIVEKTRGIGEAAGMSFDVAQVDQDGKIVFQYIMGLPVDDKADYEVVKDFFASYDIIDGRWLLDGDNGKVMLGYSYYVPDRIFSKPYKVGDKITVNDIDLKIVGFIEEIGSPTDDAQVYTTVDTLGEILGEDVTIGMITANADNVEEIEDIKERVKKNLRDHRDLEEGKEDFTVTTYAELIESFGAVLNIVIGFIVLIALVSVFVSAINTANTMFTSILERTKEIGIIKAIGATNQEVLMIFLLESSMLGFIAGLIGVLFGWFLADLGGKLLAALGWGFLSPQFPWWLFAVLIGFATLVGMISGTIPAYNASKKSPVDSLRYE